ncbi:hypothetical protein BO70DRAFT_31538 [Aspergillus heteromorphus CBS 117.55]|uniref:Uncharacterized protein n=1 Tax=Aspergillus heteromorphus CBS 117.55 TaxID=1448321 RepID=A0A317WCG3_9EURO|nr:uncharacterized protein BO70DRAFT_31538 [Aspergillus heteromorphus CBS 117.55]PWY82892.1 hypothetical protein BO70DRAFT_31538 [Aspergillus heteromorphus CBS 117.55]
MTAKTTYRALLRELPRRSLSSPTPLQNRVRELYGKHSQTPSTTNTSTSTPPPKKQAEEAEEAEGARERRIAEARQFAMYARAQRTYAELVERYNPGMTLEEEERIRLTARRVGWDLPVEVKN